MLFRLQELRMNLSIESTLKRQFEKRLEQKVVLYNEVTSTSFCKNMFFIDHITVRY